MTAEKSGPWPRRLWTAGKIALLLAISGAVVYWFLFAPVAVERHTVEPGEVVAEVMGTGTFEAHIQATISSKISGRLVQVNVDQGAQVQAEQIVGRLEDEDLKQEVEIEEANVTVRKAGVERSQADVSHAKANLDLATGNLARAKLLLPTGGVAEKDYDKTVETLAVARAGLVRTEAALDEARKQLVSTGKSLKFRQARLADAVIKAPFAGIVIRRDRNVGDVVVAGSSILAVVRPEELWVAAYVDETQMARLQPGLPTRVVFRAEPERSCAGKVVRLGRETDRETRETRVDVSPGQLPPNWSVGQRAEVYIETARKHAEVVVPRRFLVGRDGQPGVFVEANGRTAWRSLTLGLRGRETVEVISGLVRGEVVVGPADPKTTLTDGKRVYSR